LEITVPPTTKNGKICYLELPTTDIARSSEFYNKVFGWKMRTRGDGAVAFDDSVGEVSGSFIVGRPASSGAPGLLIYIMVDSLSTTLDAIVANGGKIVQPTPAGSREIIARFSDPAGNVIGLYQERA
jgi:predicted enzyme related to lactoylglutathione lyase